EVQWLSYHFQDRAGGAGGTGEPAFRGKRAGNRSPKQQAVTAPALHGAHTADDVRHHDCRDLPADALLILRREHRHLEWIAGGGERAVAGVAAAADRRPVEVVPLLRGGNGKSPDRGDGLEVRVWDAGRGRLRHHVVD